MATPLPNLVADESMLLEKKAAKEKLKEDKRLRTIQSEGVARATAQTDEDRALAKGVAMNRFSKSGKRVMSPAQAAAKTLRGMEPGNQPAVSTGASGFQGTGMDGKPGFQMRTEAERLGRIGSSPVSVSATPLSSMPVTPTQAPVSVNRPFDRSGSGARITSAPTVTGVQGIAADAQSFNMTNAGIVGAPKALANIAAAAPTQAPAATPAPAKVPFDRSGSGSRITAAPVPATSAVSAVPPSPTPASASPAVPPTTAPVATPAQAPVLSNTSTALGLGPGGIQTGLNAMNTARTAVQNVVTGPARALIGGVVETGRKLSEIGTAVKKDLAPVGRAKDAGKHLSSMTPARG